MNAVMFEKVVGRSLVSVHAENMNMLDRGRYFMNEAWVRFAATDVDDFIVEFKASPYSIDNIPYEDRWIMTVSEASVELPTRVMFSFRLPTITKVSYFTQQVEEKDHSLGINEIDTVVLSCDNENELVLLGFTQFQIISEICLIFENKHIQQWLEDCTEIPRKIVSIE